MNVFRIKFTTHFNKQSWLYNFCVKHNEQNFNVNYFKARIDGRLYYLIDKIEPLLVQSNTLTKTYNNNYYQFHQQSTSDKEIPLIDKGWTIII